MESSAPLVNIDPRPISSPSNAYQEPYAQQGPYPQQSPYPPQGSYPPQGQYPPQSPYPQIGDPSAAPGADPGIALHLGPESQIPDHPGSVLNTPNVPRPTQVLSPQAISAPADLRALKTTCQFGLREYLSLQRKRQRFDASTSTIDLESRIRAQAGVVLGDLRTLQSEVRGLVKAAENHRWRRWVIGGVMATFIPFLRRIFRRGSDEESQSSANDTEYAYKKSKGLITHIKDSLLGKGHFASVAFFVFSVLYVFQNEVSLRVAKTVQKRVKKLCAKIERGDPDMGDGDMKLLEGWRWRVLLW